MANNRYPGPKPFSDKEAILFFGREDDKSNLINTIKANRLTILFGRSGYGKSSLIHAGVIPYFKNEAVNYKILEIRFGSYIADQEGHKSLRQQLIGEIKRELTEEPLFLNEVEDEDEETTLWQYFKTYQWKAKKDGFNGVLFIMDQFEEIFNFPESQYKQLADQLSEIIYNRVPYSFQNDLIEKYSLLQNKEQIEYLKNESSIYFLIGIRSDRIYLLDEMGHVIPMIFNNRFKLSSLGINKVDDVIKRPAELFGDFNSLPFEYSEEVLTEIKSYFTNNSNSNNVETFQLQIICEYLEKRVIESQKSMSGSVNKIIIVNRGFLPEKVEDIIKNYYVDIIKGTGNLKEENFIEVEELLVRFLIERKLIDVKTNSRICLDKTSINPLGISNKLLDKLIDTKIIRRELNTVSGQSFELSHDSLVKPILNATQDGTLQDLDEILYDYYTQALTSSNKLKTAEFRENILPKLITSIGNLTPMINDSSPYDNALKTLLSKNILIKGKKGKTETLILNEAFQDVVIKKRNEELIVKQNKLRSYYLAGLTSLFLFVIFMIIIALILNNQFKKENAQNVLNTTNFSSPIIDTTMLRKKLLLLKEIFYKFKDDSVNRKKTETILLDFFNNNYFTGIQISKPYLVPLTVSINSTNRLLVIYGVPNADQAGIPYKTKSAFLYDQNGVEIDSVKNILAAQFDKANGEAYVITKDNLIIFRNNNNKTTHLNYKNLSIEGNDTIKTFNISSINNGNIYANIQFASNKLYSIVVDSKGVVNFIKNTWSTNYVGSLLTDTSLNKNIVLSYTTQDSILHLESFKSIVLLDRSLNFKISQAFFSVTGDTIFVNGDREFITILNSNSLKTLSKYKSSINQNLQGEKIFSLIAYNNGQQVILINLKNPELKNLNTTDVNSVIAWMTNNWGSLSSDEKEIFNLNDNFFHRIFRKK